ncbi:MAG: hypothetical protein U9R06_00510 [Patescibacteria group bacterium]|nr:hypothetical protein [Patescibacteria group bacterium]
MNNYGFTGGITEREMLGGTRTPQKEENIPGVKEYIRFDSAIAYAKKLQASEDPSDPDTRFANDLHATIAGKLNLENYADLKFYSSIGTHLDKYYGVDAFFEIKIDNVTVLVTMDITTNPNKGDQYKADTIINMPKGGLDPDLSEDKEVYRQKIEEVSGEVVKIICSKYDEIISRRKK